MKRTSIVLILIFFILNLFVHVNIYYREVNDFYNAPCVMYSDGQYLHAVFDTGKRIAIVQSDKDGNINEAAFVSKGGFLTGEIASVEDIAVKHGKTYVLWNYQDYETGKLTRQAIEDFSGNRIRIPGSTQEMLIEVPVTDGFKLNHILVSDEDEIFVSGVSNDKRYAVFFTLDQENKELMNKTQYLIAGGAYRSYTIGEEKYCISVEGNLMGIENGAVTQLYEGLVRNINAQPDGTVIFQDVLNGELYILKDGEVEPYTYFDLDNAVLGHEMELIDISIYGRQTSYFKMTDAVSGEIYYLGGGRDDLQVVPQFQLDFVSLIRVVFFNSILFFLVGCVVIVALTAIYYRWLKSKRVSISILVSMIPVFVIAYGVLTFCVILQEKSRVVDDYHVKAMDAAEYLEKSYQVYEDRAEEADRDLYVNEITSEVSQEFAGSQTIILRSVGGQQLVVDIARDCFLERPEKLYSRSMTIFLKNAYNLENPETTFQSAPFTEGIYSFNTGTDGKGIFVSGYGAGLLYGVFVQAAFQTLAPAFGIFLVVFIALALFLRRQLKPVSMIREEIEEWTKGNYTRLTVSKKNSEVFDIVRILNGSVNDFTARIYQLSRLNTAYFRFVPQNIMKILERESVVDVEAGDKKGFVAPVAYFLMMQSQDVVRSDEERFAYSNQYFAILNSVLMDYQSMFSLINDDLTKITAAFEGKTSALLSLSKRLLSEIEQFNKYNQENIITPLIVIAKPQVTLAMAGDNSRITPMLITAESSTVDIINNTFESSGCEVILLQTAFKDMPNLDKNDYRYIGYMEIENESKIIGMYDYFAASNEKTVKMKRETLPLFNEAMESFYVGDFQKAKELYSKVLDIDSSDGIARWYLFRCYEYENKGDSIDVSYALIKKKNFKGFDR